MTACSECEDGKLVSQHLIQMDCGHRIGVEELDRIFELNKVYRINNGVIEAVKITKTFSSAEKLQCPECGKPMENVGRYKLGSQLQQMPDTIERLIAQMGSNISKATESLFRNEAYLRQSKVMLRDALKSGPLGGMHNQRHVQERLSIVRNLKQRTTEFRDAIVFPFDEGLRRLCAFINHPDVLSSVAPTFTFRFNVLNYLCRLVGLEDAERILQVLSGLEADQHTSVFMEGLKEQMTRQIATDMGVLETVQGVQT
jgi:hypothetical protein